MPKAREGEFKKYQSPHDQNASDKSFKAQNFYLDLWPAASSIVKMHFICFSHVLKFIDKPMKHARFFSLNLNGRFCKVVEYCNCMFGYGKSTLLLIIGTCACTSSLRKRKK